MQRYMLSILYAICLLASWAYAVLSVVAGLVPKPADYTNHERQAHGWRYS